MKAVPVLRPAAAAMLLPAAAVAADAPAMPPAFDLNALVQLGLGLLGVIVVILLLAWLLRQLPTLRRQSGQIAIVGGLAVGNRERIVLVEVQGTRILLGVTQDSVNALHVFPAAAVHTPPADHAATPRRSVVEPGLDFRQAMQALREQDHDGSTGRA